MAERKWRGLVLDKTNYRVWSVMTKAAIEAKEAWEVIDPSYGLPADEKEEEDKDVTPKDLRKKDAVARLIILDAAGDEGRLRILHCTTAKEQWEELKRWKNPLGREQLSAALGRFYGYTPPSKPTVGLIVNELRTAWLDIETVDPLQTPSVEVRILSLYKAVRTIDPEYNSVILQLDLQGINNFEAIVSQLEEVERRITAIITEMPAVELLLRTTDRRQNDRKCFHCGKQGHFRAKCHSWLRTDEGKAYAIEHPTGKEPATTGPIPTPGAKGRLSPSEDAMQVREEYTGESCWYMDENSGRTGEISGGVQNSWVVDSGATCHMTPDLGIFISYRPLAVERLVRTASGSVMKGVAEGTVVLYIRTDGKVKKVRLTGVLHVPEIHVNLISVPQLQDRGISVETTVSPEKKAMVLKFQGKRVAIAGRYGRSYVLKVEEEYARLAVTDGPALGNPEYALWHRRFGHLGAASLSGIHEATDDTLKRIQPSKDEPKCDICLRTKAVRVVSRKPPVRATKPLERVYSDFWGPYVTPSMGKEVYFLSFTDDYTRKSWVLLTRTRAELPRVFARWKSFVERQSGHLLKALRTDNATEYIAMRDAALATAGIILELTSVYTPEQNGVSERLNRSLITMVRSMLLEAGMPHFFWGDAVIMACYLRNRMLIGPKVIDKSHPGGVRIASPEEAFTGRKPGVSHIRTFGCIAYAHVPKETRNKLEPNAIKTILIGYMPTSRQYRLYNPLTKSIIISSSPVFAEDTYWDWGNAVVPVEGFPDHPYDPMLPVEYDDDEWEDPGSQLLAREQEPDTSGQSNMEAIVDTGPYSAPESPEGQGAAPVDQGAVPELVVGLARSDMDELSGQRTPGSLPLEPDDTEVDQASDDQRAGPSEAPLGGVRKRKRKVYGEATRHSTRERTAKVTFEAARTALDEPRIPVSYEEAMADPEYGHRWKEAWEEEINKLIALGTWEEADLPPDTHLIGWKTVFTVKHTVTELLDCFKARIVARGFSQRIGDDYGETYSPTVRPESLRVLMAVSNYRNWEIDQLDVVSAYPRADLHAELYMKVPYGVKVSAGKVLRIKKALYGLKQSGREWYLEAAKHLEILGLLPTHSDPCVFCRKEDLLIIGLYVDDMLIFSPSVTTVMEFKNALKGYWKVKDLGPVHKILGMIVERNRELCTLEISQEDYLIRTVEEHGFTGMKPCTTPCPDPKSVEPAGKNEPPVTNPKQYQELIGTLLFLMRMTRPDLAYVIGKLSRYVAWPCERHLKAVKRVIRYAWGTRKFRIAFKAGKASEKLVGYVDSNYAEDRTDRTSTYGYLFLLCGGPISWISKRQRSVSTSTTEAEYVALCQGSKEALWLRTMLKELEFTQFLGGIKEVRLLSDNQACIALAENPEQHSRSKHIDVQYHFVRQLVEYRKVAVEYCPSANNLADGLTKPLLNQTFPASVRRFVGP